MGTWKVDTERKPGILWLELEGKMTVEEMAAFVAAHNTAIDRFRGKDYKVFCDIRNVKTLSPECTELMEQAKSYSNDHANFRGSAVWVPSITLSLQHRRTSIASGVLGTELISEDEQALWKHLDKVHRNVRGPGPG